MTVVESAVEEEPAAERPLGRPIPAEGGPDGFSQTWFPVCLSSELAAGPVGVDFLDGRVVAYRDAAGRAVVHSGYCLHLGADLSVGEVVDGQLRCRFHGWRYGADGRCAATGIGDPVPNRARLFDFPVIERYGIVWAFNGREPLFELPELPHPEDELVGRPGAIDEVLDVDPWVISAQTLDLQHFLMPHGFALRTDPTDSVSSTDFSMGYQLSATVPGDLHYDVRVDIHGTNIFWQTGTLGGRWFYWISAMQVPSPGRTKAFYVLGTRRPADGDLAATQEFLGRAGGLMMSMLADDAPVMRSIHMKPGLLTRADTPLARFFEYLRRYPHAHPSASYLR
jgi:phenylpropionate dioxygenase-like ring-hydroxylating dioxygenase large terminal subunit